MLNCSVKTDITGVGKVSKLHKNWVTPHSSRYYVATPDLKQEFVNVGVPEDIIKITGIPISEQFDEDIDTKVWMHKNHLDGFYASIL